MVFLDFPHFSTYFSTTTVTTIGSDDGGGGEMIITTANGIIGGGEEVNANQKIAGRSPSEMNEWMDG